jgi:hypothetical protein
VARAGIIWLGVRLVIAMLKAISLAPPAAVGIVALVSWLTLLDGRRLHEDVFLGNLGVSEWPVAVAAAVPPALLEILVALAVAA